MDSLLPRAASRSSVHHPPALGTVAARRASSAGATMAARRASPFWATLAVAAAAAVVAAAPTASAAALQSGCVQAGRPAIRLGYYGSWGANWTCHPTTPALLNAAGDDYTHLAWSFADVGPNLTLAPAAEEDAAHFARFNSIKESRPNLRTLIAVGGWAFNDDPVKRDRWSRMVATEKTRRAFAASAVQFIVAYGFDGVDLDWEFPVAEDRAGRPEDRANYVALVAEMRAQFWQTVVDGRQPLLSVAVPCGGRYLNGFDLPGMAKHVDWIGAMCYDLAGAWGPPPYTTGAHTNLTSIVSAVDGMRAAGVPDEKLLLGMAAYGRTWTLSDPAACAAGGAPFCNATAVGRAGPCTDEAGALSVYEVDAAMAKQGGGGCGGAGGMVAKGTAAGSAWTIIDGDQWVSYDTTETAALKLAAAKERCLAGTMVWSINMADASHLYGPIA